MQLVFGNIFFCIVCCALSRLLLRRSQAKLISVKYSSASCRMENEQPLSYNFAQSDPWWSSCRAIFMVTSAIASAAHVNFQPLIE